MALVQVNGAANRAATRLTAEQNIVQGLTKRADQAAAQNAALAGRIAALEPAARDQIDVKSIAARVAPSVFTVDTPTGLGSGWVARSAGGHSLIVTDFHVVAEVWNANARLVGIRQSNTAFDGTIVKVDRGADLALIDVARSLPVLTIVSAPPNVGDTVAAFGSPLDLGGSVTSGIVSAIRQEGIQFTAAISPGNSGGPVVDRNGAVVGVAQMSAADPHAQALNFAIPSARVCASLGVC